MRAKISIAIYIAAVLVGCAGPLAAQPDMATDQELFAAYCLGRVQQDTKDWGLIGIASVDATIQRDFAHETARLRAYLVSHGMGIPRQRSTLANEGLTNAIVRGRTDSANCWATIKVCVKSCNKPKPVGYDKQCTQDCANENPACRNTARCNELQLPP